MKYIYSALLLLFFLVSISGCTNIESDGNYNNGLTLSQTDARYCISGQNCYYNVLQSNNLTVRGNSNYNYLVLNNTGLVAYYTFDSVDGSNMTVFRNKVDGVNGTVGDTTYRPYMSSGMFKESYYYNGITTPRSSNSKGLSAGQIFNFSATGFSVSFWYKVFGGTNETSGGGQTLIMNPLTIDPWTQFLITPAYYNTDNKTSFLIRNSTYGNTQINANSGYKLNTWYHVVCRWNTSNMSMYINGVKQTETKIVNSMVANVSFDSLRIGLNNGIIGTFNGTIDEVRIYNRSLNDNEITDLYQMFAPNSTQYTITTYENYVGIQKNYPSYPLHVGANNTGISIRAEGNMSATGYMTTTTKYRPKGGKKALDWIQDANKYNNSNGTIIHERFYGGSNYTIQKDIINKSVSTTKECAMIGEQEQCRISTKEENIVVGKINETIGTVSINEEIDVLRQAVYDMKIELCNKNSNYNWC